MTDIERMDRCANASVVLTRADYDSQGHKCSHLLACRTVTGARFADLQLLEAEMRALWVTA